MFIYFFTQSQVFFIGVKLLFYAVEFKRTKVNVLQVSLFLLKKNSIFHTVMKTKILSETFMLEARGLQKTTCLTFRGEGRTVSPVTVLFGCTAAAQSQAAGRLAVDFQTAACVSLQTSSPECRTPNVSRATRLSGGDSRVASRQRSQAVGSVGCSRQTDLPEVCHRIHSTSSSRLNFQICLYSRVARSQSSGPAAVTKTSHGGGVVSRNC